MQCTYFQFVSKFCTCDVQFQNFEGGGAPPEFMCHEGGILLGRGGGMAKILLRGGYPVRKTMIHPRCVRLSVSELDCELLVPHKIEKGPINSCSLVRPRPCVNDLSQNVKKTLVLSPGVKNGKKPTFLRL